LDEYRLSWETSVKAVSPLDQSLLLPSTIRVKNNGGEYYKIPTRIAIKTAKKISNLLLYFIKILFTLFSHLALCYLAVE
jgi:hypothetical protein|tara:strand:- start:477 stop:713 length:237 start_codon:yes stop_codon:yes gene_type:complete